MGSGNFQRSRKIAMSTDTNSNSPTNLSIHYAGETDAPGTLLWIGERSSEEFRDAFEHCQASASQVAVRQNLDDAFLRPAATVKAIVVTRLTTKQHCEGQLRRLADSYPDATFIQILGSLCAGERPSSSKVFGERTIYAHQCNQYLPTWLSECGVKSIVESRAPSSILIVAHQHSNAEPLMDLASSAGIPTLWCKRPSGNLVRNVSAVWWDDSAARPTTTRNWQHRINEIEASNRQIEPSLRCRHVWLACWPRHQQIRTAIDGGIDLVISKPHEISLLSETIMESAHQDDCRQSNDARSQRDHGSRAA